MWQGRNEDLEREIAKLQQKDRKLEEDKDHVAEQYKQEYMQLKADRDATIDQLKGLLEVLWKNGQWVLSRLRIWLFFFFFFFFFIPA